MMVSRVLTIVALSFFVPSVVVFAQVPPVPEKTSAASGPRPRLVIPERVRDLGTIISGDKVEFGWDLRNEGDADLVIERTKTGCGCTVVDLKDEEKVIPPGKSITLRAKFDSMGRAGDQTKIVTIHSNDPQQPTSEVTFKAKVDVLYNLQPPGKVNLRALRRGEAASDTLDLTPQPGRGAVEILDFKLRDPGVLKYRMEPLRIGTVEGTRVHFAVSDTAPLGHLITDGSIRFRIGEVERTVPLDIFADIVPELVCNPDLIRPTAEPMSPGRRLAPVTISSSTGRPFRILEANGGTHLDVECESAKGAPENTKYTCNLTIRETAPAGPFALKVSLRTDSLDQPVLGVPVFGIVAEAIRVEPAEVVLRADKTPAGSERRVELRALPKNELRISKFSCDNPAVSVELESGDADGRPYVQYIKVAVREGLPAGMHSSILTLETNIDGAKVLKVPVRIEVPG